MNNNIETIFKNNRPTINKERIWSNITKEISAKKTNGFYDILEIIFAKPIIPSFATATAFSLLFFLYFTSNSQIQKAENNKYLLEYIQSSYTENNFEDFLMDIWNFIEF